MRALKRGLDMDGKILVTGATGFTGRALCERLLRNGETVVVLARPSHRLREIEALGAEVRVVDMADERQVLDRFEPFKQIFHIAAAFRTEHNHIDEFRRANVTVTRCLLSAAMRTRSGRFVYCSTVGVQGEIVDPPADEAYRYSPGDDYQQSKMEAELLVLEHFKRGLTGTVVRPVGIYGPGDTRFLKLFRPVSRGRFVMIGSGEVLYQLTYIDDLIQGFVLAGERPEAVGEIFTIGGAEYSTLNQLVATIAEVTGAPLVRWHVPYAPVHAAAVISAAVSRVLGVNPILFPRRVEFFKKPRAFSIDKARRLLGYTPAFNLSAGIQSTADWYRRAGWI